jgi:hypothetical protein
VKEITHNSWVKEITREITHSWVKEITKKITHSWVKEITHSWVKEITKKITHSWVKKIPQKSRVISPRFFPQEYEEHIEQEKIRAEEEEKRISGCRKALDDAKTAVKERVSENFNFIMINYIREAVDEG